MSDLISGKEALIALANGEKVGIHISGYKESYWINLRETRINTDEILNEKDRKGQELKFRINPKTITINGIEVPAPFKPEVGEEYFYLNLQRECLYAAKIFNRNHSDNSAIELGAWRTEDEIKQVVEALRSIFK